MSEGDEDHGKIEELPNLQQDIDSDQIWSLHRIGAQGTVLLLRAFFKLDKQPKAEPVPAGTIPPMTNGSSFGKTGVNVISITTLTDFSYSINTALPKGTASWHRTGLFYQAELPPLLLPTPATLPENENNNNNNNNDMMMTMVAAASPRQSFSATPLIPSSMMMTTTATSSIENETPSEFNRISGIALNTPAAGGRVDMVFGKPAPSTQKKDSRVGLPPTSKKRKPLGPAGKEEQENDFQFLLQI
jgi:hypothetical protein